MVKVYSAPTCPWCKKTKDYLKSKKIDYVDVNVQDDIEGRDEMIQLTGDMSIPVIRFNDNFVVGFKKDEIDKNLAMI